MVDTDAEADRTHVAQVGDLVLERLEDDPDPHVVGRVNVRQVGGGVAGPALPSNLRQIGAVVHAEVLERRQQVAFQRFPEPEFDGDAAVEPVQDVLTVGSFGCGREAEQHLGFEVFEQSGVGLRLGPGVVELVDDDHVKLGGVEIIEIQPGQRLHRGEDVAPLTRPLAADELLTERAVAHDMTERVLALSKDLVAVGDEQERIYPAGLMEAPVVEPGDDGLPGPGGHHDEISVSVVDLAFGRQLVEDFALVPPWSYVE